MEPVVVPEATPVETPAPVEEIKIDLPEAPAEVTATVAESPAEQAPQEVAPVVEAAPTPVEDPLQIDLGEVNIPASTPEAVSNDTSTNDADKRVFKPLDTDIAGPDVSAPTPTPTEVPTPVESSPIIADTTIVLNDIPAAPIEVPAPVVEPVVAPVEEPIINMEPVVVETPAPEVAPVVEAIPEQVVEQPSMMEQLTDNEKLHINDPIEATAPQEAPAPVAEAATVSNETSLDLDSLTQDIAAMTAGNETPAPAQASVTLPIENTAILKPHKSIKKKVFVSLAGFILLAVVTGLVAKVMFPLESESLLASITGGSETPETPILIDSTITETPTEVVTETPVDTGASTIDTGTTTTETLPAESATITAEEAEATLNVIADESRKKLAVALKTKNKTAEGMLYKTFKDSSALLEELANTSDITTMTTLKEEIETLQNDLSYATSLLDETGNDSGS